VHRDFAQVAIWENGRVVDAGTVATSPEGLRAFASTVTAEDEVALEATMNTSAIAAPVGAALWPGGGFEPIQDPSHRRGEAEDRQGRRPSVFVNGVRSVVGGR
jgi:hypothetical protein